MGYGSNRGRPSEIGRLGRFGHEGRRRDVVGALCGTSGFTDLRLGWDLAGEGQSGTCKPPGHSGKGFWARDVVRGGGEVLGHGGSRRRRRSDH